jgi:phenylacetate-CoA ligase
MPDAMLHCEFEMLAASELRTHQEKLWQTQWAQVSALSEFYRAKAGPAVPDTLSLQQLETFPFTTKEELRASQEAAFPFGTYVACGADQIVRVHRTSGTTGRPLQLANTRRDVDLIARVGGRSQFAAGLRPGDRVVHCLNYCMWTGGVTDHMTLEEAGACVVPFGVGNTDLLLTTIAELGITAISCTPSYPALLERRLRDLDRAPRGLALRLGLFGGEPGLDNPAFRARLEEVWGFSARNANYGMSEVLSNFASQCERSTDLHFHGADALFVEIIAHDDTRLPISEGTTGELVCTHLAKQCQPLIRFRTRDVVTITGTGPCACGRTGWRFRVTGRTDDMFNVRGINVFPSAVQQAMWSRPDLTSGQFRIVLTGSGPWDRIPLRAEAAHGLRPAAYPEAAAALAEAVRRFTGASAEVTMVPPDSLPRTAGKTTLVERHDA